MIVYIAQKLPDYFGQFLSVYFQNMLDISS